MLHVLRRSITVSKSSEMEEMMSLPLTNIDDRTYADLIEEARAMITTYDPTWTNHNPSDPGITLIELFAWLAEMLIYRANRVTDQHRRVFLKLLNGPDWQPSDDIEADIYETVVDLRRRYRAVTCADYELLAKAVAPDEIARVKCVPQRYLDAPTDEARRAFKAGYISTIIVPMPVNSTVNKQAEHSYAEEALQPTVELCKKVRANIEPRRTLATRHYVVGPVYVPVLVEVTVVGRADITSLVFDGHSALDQLRQEIVTALRNFLSPIRWSPDGFVIAGWPFGRNIYVSELYELLEGIAGVDYVTKLELASKCTTADGPRCVAAKELWHVEGDFIGLELAEHHLPLARIDPDDITIEQPEPA